MTPRQRTRRRRYRGRLMVPIVATGVALASYALYLAATQPCIQDIPRELRVEEKPWMRLAPKDLVYFQTINFTEIETTPEGREVLGDKPVLVLVSPNVTLSVRDVDYVIGLLLQDNTFVNVLKLTEEAEASLSEALGASAPLAEEYYGVRVHQTMALAEETGVQRGYLASIGGFTIYVDGGPGRLQAVKKVLEAAFDQGGFFARAQVKEVLSLSSPKEGSILAFSFTIPSDSTVGETGIMKVMYLERGDIILRTAYEFAGREEAIGRLDEVKGLLFPRSRAECVVGSFIFFTEIFPGSELKRVLPSI